MCKPTSGNTCKRLTQTEFRGVCADVEGEVWVKPSHIFEIILNRSNWICSLSPAAVISQSTDVRWMCLWTAHWSECGSWRAVIGWSVCQQWARAYTSVRAERRDKSIGLQLQQLKVWVYAATPAAGWAPAAPAGTTSPTPRSSCTKPDVSVSCFEASEASLRKTREERTDEPGIKFTAVKSL